MKVLAHSVVNCICIQKLLVNEQELMRLDTWSRKAWFCRCILCNALWAREIQKSHVTKTKNF